MSGVFPFTSRFLTAPDYVLTLHQPENRVAILVRNRARAQTIQRILLAEDIADSRIQDWLKEQNNAGADIFLGMNPLRANSFARTKESVREIRHVYLDLDADAPASLRTIRTDGNTPVPTFVLDTSPEKNQVVWRVDGLDRQAAEALMRSLANQFQGDIAATDIARVLRMPGYANRKYNEAFVVRAIQQSDAIYHLRDFAIHEDSPEAPRRVSEGYGAPRRMPSGHPGQPKPSFLLTKVPIPFWTPNSAIRLLMKTGTSGGTCLPAGISRAPIFPLLTATWNIGNGPRPKIFTILSSLSLPAKCRIS